MRFLCGGLALTHKKGRFSERPRPGISPVQNEVTPRAYPLHQTALLRPGSSYSDYVRRIEFALEVSASVLSGSPSVLKWAPEKFSAGISRDRFPSVANLSSDCQGPNQKRSRLDLERGGRGCLGFSTSGADWPGASSRRSGSITGTVACA